MKLSTSMVGDASGRSTKSVFVGGPMHGQVVEINTAATAVTVDLPMKPGREAEEAAPELMDAQCMIRSAHRRRIFKVRTLCANTIIDTLVWNGITDDALPALLASAFVSQAVGSEHTIEELATPRPPTGPRLV